jgi:hypothetical protein
MAVSRSWVISLTEHSPSCPGLTCKVAADADPFVDILTQRAITPVSPLKANRKIRRACDFALYCERNIVDG